MSNNKKLSIFDNGVGLATRDNMSIKGTSIVIRDRATGKQIFRGSNKVIVSGSELNALKDFTFSDYSTNDNFSDKIKSYDAALSANNHPLVPGNTTTAMPLYPYTEGMLSIFNGNTAINSLDDNHKAAYMYLARRICLFCVGIDGCGLEASRVFKVQNTKWIAPYGYARYDNGNGTIVTDVQNCLIPFKYRAMNADLTPTNRETYYGRSIDSSNTAISYYFKAFDAEPQLIRRYADDSADLDSVTDVWKDNRTSEAEIVVALKMSLSNTDCREYFNTSFGLSSGRVNTISLCSAVPCVYLDASASGARRKEYMDIRPVTKFNFPNEALVDSTKGLDISYYLYY